MAELLKSDMRALSVKSYFGISCPNKTARAMSDQLLATVERTNQAAAMATFEDELFGFEVALAKARGTDE